MGFGDITNCFSEIASAIRSKTGGSGTYTPSQMAGAINGISTGVDINSFGIQTNNASEYVNTNILSATASSEGIFHFPLAQFYFEIVFSSN